MSKETLTQLAELPGLGSGFLAMNQIPLVLNGLNQEFMLGRICGVQNWEELEERAWLVNLWSPKEFPSGDQGQD